MGKVGGGRRRHQVLAPCLTLWVDSCLTSTPTEGSRGGGKGVLVPAGVGLRDSGTAPCAAVTSSPGHLHVLPHVALDAPDPCAQWSGLLIVGTRGSHVGACPFPATDAAAACRS